jgi:uncharacterized protein YcfL
MIRWRLFLSLFLLIGCKSKEPNPIPSGIYSKDTLVMLFAETQIINAKGQHREARSQKLAELILLDEQHLFDSLGVTQEKYKKSLDFYLEDYDLMSDTYDEVLTNLSTKLAKLRSQNSDSASSVGAETLIISKP